MTNQILKRFSNIFAILVLLIFFGIAYLFKDILDQSSIKGIGFIVFMFGYALSLLIVGLLDVMGACLTFTPTERYLHSAIEEHCSFYWQI